MHRVVVLVAGLFFSVALAAQVNLTAGSALEDSWNTIPTEGVCTSGTPFQFYTKNIAQSNQLLIYFNSGGSCWFGEACDLNSEPNIHSPFADMADNDPSQSDGIFSMASSDNPFADYAMVFIPYCTGDVHIGSGETTYTYTDDGGRVSSVKTYHNGYVNSTTVLDWVYRQYDTLEQIVVSGSSAGAIGASFYAGLVADHYRGVPVILIADAAGGYNSPNLTDTFNAWDTASILPYWSEYLGKTNDTLDFEDFYIASANHNPNLTIAQYNAAEDASQYGFSYLLGDSPGGFSLAQRLLNHYIEIESGVDAFYSYTAGGTQHMILRYPRFYRYEVEGVRFVDWVDRLVNNGSVRDVSCVNESAGCDVAPGQ